MVVVGLKLTLGASKPDYPELAECPLCSGYSLSFHTAPGSSHARVSCYSCGAEGPIDPRGGDPYDRASEGWNAWADAMVRRRRGEE